MTNEDAIKILEEMPIASNVHFEAIAEAIGIAIKALRNERPKGKWLEWEDERWGGVWYYCSNCHNDALYKRADGTFKQILSDYCPVCGAEMEVDNDKTN